ncbi:DUF2164 domain-containing protein [Ilyobacter sp.]|uniref:DUF2164 domain-containing protein n=1 Tax=Ilyobacter sp. TaxID=3100343 RepID=UPI0035649FD4
MFKLEKYEEEKMIREIQRFFMEERDEEIGNLASIILIDFISKNLGKFYYNRGVQDSYKFMSDKLTELSEIEKY